VQNRATSSAGIIRMVSLPAFEGGIGHPARTFTPWRPRRSGCSFLAPLRYASAWPPCPSP